MLPILLGAIAGYVLARVVQILVKKRRANDAEDQIKRIRFGIR